MRKTISVLMLALVLALSFATVAGAASIPVGGCPVGFSEEPFMHHDHESEHFHAGLKVDLNGDGLICMKEATDSIHVHVDNVIVLP